MIIAGGVDIYPQETENLLSAHPAVLRDTYWAGRKTSIVSWPCRSVTAGWRYAGSCPATAR
jgi:hypothetical protein